jgi:hypothetical protein
VARPDNLGFVTSSDARSAPAGRDPRADYTRHLEARRAALAVAIRQHVRFGNLRAGALAAIVAVAYLAFARGLFSAWWLLAPAVAFLWIGGRLERAVKTRARLDRAVAFYERSLARLDGKWAGTGGETGVRFLDGAHLYTNDLDLFGEASLFELLSCARTRIGEDTLAGWLKAPADPQVVRARQEAVTELAPRTDLREDLAVLGEDARTGLHAEALATWGEQPSPLGSSAVPAWAWALSAAGALAAAALLTWLVARLELLDLDADTLAALRTYGLTVFAICGVIVWRFHARAAAIFHHAEDAAHDLGLLAGVLGRLEVERFTAARLAVLRAELDVQGQPPSRRITTLNTLMGLVDSRHHVLLRMVGPLLLLDLHLAYAIERWRRASGPAVRRWLVAVGEIEALSSLAGYHYEHPNDVFPDLVDGPPCLDADGLGHPLLADAVSVRNDVRLTGELRMLVVSGSNMSGKSTLLRTVGVNAVLAQAGAPVRAIRLQLTPLEIGASIRTQDSLHSGVSRFYAEITRLGHIMQRASGKPAFAPEELRRGKPVLFLIDELLHGTNSHDRRIGAEAIVRGLVERGSIGLVTTHDLALAHVADALGARGANVHFQDVLEDGRMHFDYQMRPGVVQKSNAIELMRSVGLDV